MRPVVQYGSSKWGYRVHVFNPETGEIFEDYEAGNSARDSQVFVDPADLYAMPLKALAQFACNTAAAMAREWGVESTVPEEEPEIAPQYGGEA